MGNNTEDSGCPAFLFLGNMRENAMSDWFQRFIWDVVWVIRWNVSALLAFFVLGVAVAPELAVELYQRRNAAIMVVMLCLFMYGNGWLDRGKRGRE